MMACHYSSSSMRATMKVDHIHGLDGAIGVPSTTVEWVNPMSREPMTMDSPSFGTCGTTGLV
jgi:hypothetical protein